MLKQRAKRRLSLESLENRRVMAGNVGAWVTDGVLIVRGDDDHNAIHINQIAIPASSEPWTGAKYEISTWKFNGRTETTVNGHESVIVEGVRNGFDIALNGGNDSLYISRTTVKPNGDRVAQRASVPGDINLDTGTGADQVRFYVVNNRTSNVQLGAHSDSFDPARSLFRDLNLATDWPNGAAGNDNITLTLSAKGNVNVTMGDGDDQILTGLAPSTHGFTSHVGGKVTVNTGAGNDTVRVGGIQVDFDTSPPTLIFPQIGGLGIFLGAGSDSLMIEGMDVAADVIVRAGSDDDFIELKGLSVDGLFELGADAGSDSVRFATHDSHFSDGSLAGGDGDDALIVDNETDLSPLAVSGFENFQ